ncbi:MAG: YihY/virulence factor BrkB family protein [Acidobacteria bacterium]|nr:YihY/virulence factor BrkB family protein [Acidobacteriota bacterium]MCI0720145.1 YihY/virulence factor BrkB family protein [Acidobacteriota bacterium]
MSFLRGNSMMYAAAIAFYTLFSFFPLILILLGIGGVFIRRFSLETPIVESVRFYLPVGADLVEDNLRQITAATGPTSILAFCLLTWTASGAFIPLELALNRAWGVKRERGFLFQRVVAASMAMLCGTFILASVFATAMIGRFDRFLRVVFPKAGNLALTGIAFEVLLVLVSFFLTVCVFALIYKIVPYTKIRFSQVTPAAVMAAWTWELAKYAFTTLIRFSNYKNVYGSIATIIMILTWVYLSAAILLFFAEYSAQMQRRRT